MKITRNRTDHKMVLATQGENVIFSSTIDSDRFSPCYHEANTRLFLHLKDFSATVHRKLSLKTVDTDVSSVLSVYTRFFFISNLGFCLELGLLNSETEIGTGVA